ncbi:MAG: T9SS type A sorting domain-containing protein [Ferruginibacter sp.]
MKKIFFMLLFCMQAFLLHAQNINFPDANFKNFLADAIDTGSNTPIDTNGDGEISMTEAANCQYLSILPGSNVHDMTGIEYFVNLDGLSIENNLISILNLPMTHLSYLYCSHNPNLATLNVSSQLTTLDVSYCNLSTLSLPASPSMISITCYFNKLTTLDLTGFPNLTELYCDYNKLSSLDLSNNTRLVYLYCTGNKLTSLNVHPCTHLQLLSCGSYNLFTSLDVSGMTELRGINCDSSYITSINAVGAGASSIGPTGSPIFTIDFSIASSQLTSLDGFNIPNLYGLQCYDNLLTHTDFSVYPKLNSFQCGNNLYTSLDFSGNPWFAYLSCSNNPVTYINMKNGLNTNGTIYAVGDQATLHYVCADEVEVDMFSANFIQQGFNVNVNSYCNFEPGGDHYTINGTVRLDNDNNGCTTADPIMPGVRIKLDDGTSQGYTQTTGSGEYAFFTGNGTYTLSPEFPNAYFNINPLSTSVTTNSSNPIQTVDFCITPNGIHPDLEITLVPLVNARPGFDAFYNIVYRNKGNQVLSGNVQLSFDDTRLNFLSASPAQTTQTTGSLSWNYSNLLPFETRTIGLGFNVLAPPVNNIDDTLAFNAVVNPVAGDETPVDNSFELLQRVRGSNDPNDKICIEGETLDVTKVGDYIHYIIRFQNTGNDTAFNVVLKDMLSAKYDLNSIQAIDASAPYVFRQTGNKIEIFFANIKLPAASENEPASHGYIVFKIKPVATALLGDQLINNAAIYFDFNFPVITADAVTTINDATIVPLSMQYFKGNISGDKNILHWKANCNSGNTVFEVERSTNVNDYKKIAAITADYTRCQRPFDLTDEHPQPGMNYYRLKVIDADGKFYYSSVIALLNKKDGFEIVNIAPNPVVGSTAILNIASATEQSVTINISDATGRVVRTISKMMIAGSNQVELDLSNLSKAVYTVSVYVGNGQRRVMQFVKQ